MRWSVDSSADYSLKGMICWTDNYTRLLSLRRSYTAAGVLDGGGLMQGVLADVVESVGGTVRREVHETQALAASAGDTWTVVPLFTAPHFLANLDGVDAHASLSMRLKGFQPCTWAAWSCCL